MLVPVTFVNLIFRNFAWNDDVKSFFCIVGTSWMGSFEHFSVQFFLHVFCNSTKTSANSSDHQSFNNASLSQLVREAGTHRPDPRNTLGLVITSHFCSEIEIKIRTGEIVQSFVVVDGGTIIATVACPLAFSRISRSSAPNISLGIGAEPEEIRMLAGQEHCMSLCPTKSCIANPTA